MHKVFFYSIILMVISLAIYLQAGEANDTTTLDTVSTLEWITAIIFVATIPTALISGLGALYRKKYPAKKAGKGAGSKVESLKDFKKSVYVVVATWALVLALFILAYTVFEGVSILIAWASLVPATIISLKISQSWK